MFIYRCDILVAQQKFAPHYYRDGFAQSWCPSFIVNDGGLKVGAPPLLGEKAARYVDPLPQALILTAIVISFGVTAFFLVLAYRSYQEIGTDHIEGMKGDE